MLSLFCMSGEGRGDLGKVLDMVAEEIAECQELSVLVNAGWGRKIADCFLFVGSWKDPHFGESDSKVGNLFTTDFAFGQVDLDSMLD